MPDPILAGNESRIGVEQELELRFRDALGRRAVAEELFAQAVGHFLPCLQLVGEAMRRCPVHAPAPGASPALICSVKPPLFEASLVLFSRAASSAGVASRTEAAAMAFSRATTRQDWGRRSPRRVIGLKGLSLRIGAGNRRR